jgi:hypothetical protein
MSDVMSYTPPPDLAQKLQTYWKQYKKHNTIKRIADASEAMGMKAQYFGKLCNDQRPATVESLLKIAAFFQQSPQYFDPNFPAWAMYPRAKGDTIDTPMLYTPAPEASNKIQATWQAYKASTKETLMTAGQKLNLSHTTFNQYLDGQVLNAEFILKFSTLTRQHPRDFDPAFPAFFLVETTP